MDRKVDQTRIHVPWIDSVKGIGIALVVLGHIRETGFVHFFPYVFHMPLFFFMSGYLHRADPRLRHFAAKKSISLLIPYATFTVAITLLKLPHFFRHAVTLHRLEHAWFVLLWGGTAMKGTYGVLWFLTCLFLTQQIMNALLSRFALRTVFAFTGCSLVLAYINSIFYPHFTLPWDANVALFSSAFFLAGYTMRKNSMLGWRYTAFAIVCAAISAWLVVRGTAVYLNMKDAGFGIPVLSLALALGCIIGCVQIARLLPSSFRATKWLQRVGLLSLPIMFIHREILSGPIAHTVLHWGYTVGFLLTMAASWAVAAVMERYAITRAFFLGSASDLKALTGLEARATQPGKLAVSSS